MATSSAALGLAPLDVLAAMIRRHRQAALLFSGGLDSSLLLAVAAPLLGPDLTAITVTGPHTTPGELAHAVALARRFQVRHRILAFDPLDLPEFRDNRRERCYACKRAIIAQARDELKTRSEAALWDGTNLDDLGDFRPGMAAVRELGVVSPLLEAKMGKAVIRTASRRLGLNWQKVSESCLATRFPYDTPLSREALGRVGAAEAWLRRRGFTKVRLRVAGEAVRLELAPQDWREFLRPGVRRAFTAWLARLGFGPLDLTD